MRPLDRSALAGIHGGMRLEGLRESTNVEDRRGMPFDENLPTPEVPLPRLERRPGDLASQAGLDSMFMRDKRRG